MTPDWAARPTAVPYAVFADPQSLNLYGYVRNDPASRADLDGHAAERDAITNMGDTSPFSYGFQMGTPTDPGSQTYSQEAAKMEDFLKLARQSGDVGGPPQAQNQGQTQAPRQQDAVSATNASAQAILSQQNACSTYFNAGAGTFTGGTQISAALFLASDNVQSVNNSTFTTVGGTSTQGAGQGSTIAMNLNSPFMLPVRPQNGGPPMIFTIGPFISASPQGKVGMLFHELAHTLNMIPRDGGNRDQSIKNTQTIMEHCEAAIRSYFH